MQGTLLEVPAAGRVPESVGPHVRAYREKLGVSRKELADLVGVSAKTVVNSEDGTTRRPDTVRRLLEALVRIAEAPTLPPAGALTRPPWLHLPAAGWNAEWFGPASLLTAEHQVVPFHGAARELELQGLLDWCRRPGRAGMRVYKGAGGMGKTRLAIELCRRLPESGDPWLAGFLRVERFPRDGDPWLDFGAGGQGALVVVDYAGEEPKIAMVTRLLAELPRCPLGRIRLLLLDRDDLWLGRLLDQPAAARLMFGRGLGDFGEAVRLRPVAGTAAERRASWQLAAASFARVLERPPPTVPARVPGGGLDTVLLLHMQALLATLGHQAPARERDILRSLLHRERAFWQRRLVANGLGAALLPAVEAAVFWIGQNGGAADTAAAERILGAIPLLRGQPALVLRQVAGLLRECYPEGERGVAALQPDPLREFFGGEFVARHGDLLRDMAGRIGADA